MSDGRRHSLDDFLARDEDGSFYVGHATVLARVNGRLILIDPVTERPLFLDSWLFFPPLALSERLFEVDAVLISHHHEDHYDPEFLHQLKAQMPIFLTEGCTGFDRIEADPTLNTRRLPRNQMTEVFDGVSVFTIPSDHNDFDSSFIVKGEHFALFQGNDNFVSREIMERAATVTGPVDHAYIPYSYVWWYPFCLTSMTAAERDAEAERLTRRNMEIGRMMADVLDARHVIPSAGNLILCDSADSVVNRGIASPFDYAHFEESIDLAGSERVKILVAGDYILKRSDGGSEVVAQTYGKAEYFERMDSFLTDYNRSNPPPARDRSIDETELGAIRERAARLPVVDEPNKVFVRREDRPSEAVVIDLERRSVEVGNAAPSEEPFMLFEFQASPFERWLAGEVSFETVLNSQRFSVYRQPERFDEPVWRAIRNCL